MVKATKQKKLVTAKTKKTTFPSQVTAKQFMDRLKALQSDDQLKKIQRYFKSGDEQYANGDKFMGVKMGSFIL